MSSLGHVSRDRNSASLRRPVRASVQSAPTAAAPKSLRGAFARVGMPRSVWSARSLVSACSALSILSVASSLSLLSVLSIGSTLSVLSLGSTLSVLSVASVDSYMSIGSYGCTRMIFSNCHFEPSATVEVDIRLNESEWDRMAGCSSDDYQRFKKYETASNPCDYQRANCTVRNGDVTRTAFCKVRRKGFSTFRPMAEGPSWKLKFYEDPEYDDKLDLEMGPVGWVPSFKADKVTLNNMAYSTSFSKLTEVEAYDTFHRLSYPAMPTIDHVRIATYRGGERVSSYVGSIVEDVSNDDYFKRLKGSYGTDYWLLEVDNTGLEVKELEGGFEDEIGSDLVEKLLNREVVQGETGGVYALFNATEILLYYLAERLTHNWDGAFLKLVPSNHYILAWLDANSSTTRARLIPKGMDWVFQGCIYEYETADRPYGGLAQRALNEAAGSYESFRAANAALVPYTSASCSEEIGYAAAFFAGSAAAGILLALGLFASRVRGAWSGRGRA